MYVPSFPKEAANEKTEGSLSFDREPVVDLSKDWRPKEGHLRLGECLRKTSCELKKRLREYSWTVKMSFFLVNGTRARKTTFQKAWEFKLGLRLDRKRPNHNNTRVVTLGRYDTAYTVTVVYGRVFGVRPVFDASRPANLRPTSLRHRNAIKTHIFHVLCGSDGTDGFLRSRLNLRNTRSSIHVRSRPCPNLSSDGDSFFITVAKNAFLIKIDDNFIASSLGRDVRIFYTKRIRVIFIINRQRWFVTSFL